MNKQTGFTLIELAIVLVIIGLLLGGVLRGQELINSAKVKSLAADFRNIPVYIYGYQDKYRAFPGDDLNATTHTGVSTAVNGNGNGALGGTWQDTATTSEAYTFWQHVRLASLATGATTGTGDWRPTNADGGPIGIQAGTNVATLSPIITAGGAIRGSYIICTQGVLGKYVRQLDTQMDDGNTATGSMLATTFTSPAYAIGATAVATTAIVDSESYVVCFGV